MALTENICQNQLSVVLVVWEFLAFSFARSSKWVTVVKVNGDTSDEMDVFF